MTATDNAKRHGEGVPFERIRRITGYLVGTMDKWNNAKQAEERARVTHGMEQKSPGIRRGFSRF